MLNKKVYELLKWLALIVFPAIAVFIGTLGDAWGWSHNEQIAATFAGFNLLFGILVKTMPPFDGVVSVLPGADLDDPDKFDINLRGLLDDPSKIEDQRALRLKVKHHR